MRELGEVEGGRKTREPFNGGIASEELVGRHGFEP